MLTTLALKTFFSKAWVFIKHYGVYFAIGIVIIFAAIFSKNKIDTIRQLLSTQEQMSEKYRNDIAALEKLRDDEIKKREQIEAQYQAIIVQINSQHDAAIQQLAKVKETEIRAIINETKNDPVALATRINTLFGIPVLTATP